MKIQSFNFGRLNTEMAIMHPDRIVKQVDGKVGIRHMT